MAAKDRPKVPSPGVRHLAESLRGKKASGKKPNTGDWRSKGYIMNGNPKQKKEVVDDLVRQAKRR